LPETIYGALAEFLAALIADKGDASRMASILQVMRQCMEASDVERRIAEMEAKLTPTNVVAFPGKRA
jgi:hypothetical protein